MSIAKPIHAPLLAATLLLTACPWLSEADLQARLDLDGDGVPRPTDCDDDDPSVGGPTTWYADSDEDGFGGAIATHSCSAEEGLVADGSDCDDTNGQVFPGAEELCNEQDDDCDGEADDGTQLLTWYRDADQDGHGDADVSEQACYAPSGYVEQAGDCDDLDADANPDQQEICDLQDVDEDCDELADDDDPDAQGQVTVYQDEDGDSFGVEESTALACDEGQGWAFEPGDCDDDDPSLNPDTSWYRDTDEDGYGDEAHRVRSCNDVLGYVRAGGDCDDERAELNPGAQEVCDPDDVDEDCDGLADDEDDSVSGLLAFYDDVDGDGYGETATLLQACEGPAGWAELGGDCQLKDPAISPGADEVCDDGVENDCDGDSDCDDVNCSLDQVCGAFDLGEADSILLGDRDEYAGKAVALAGDVTGDGLGDLLVGATQVWIGEVNGGAYLVPGPALGSTLLEAAAVALLYSEAQNDSAGAGVAGVGDTDGDGFDDFVVGATGSDVLDYGAGAVYLWHGPVTGTQRLDLADARLYGYANMGQLGSALAGGSDLTGDGVPDLLIGGGYAYETYVVSGTVSGTVSLEDADAILDATYSGTSVAIGGDVNGDGAADLLIGSSVTHGFAYLVHEASTSSGSKPKTTTATPWPARRTWTATAWTTC